MRKFALILCLFIITIAFTGCGNPKSDKFTIVTTNFAVYDWTSNIVGSECDVVLLINDGNDVHSFQPSVKDIAEISACDLFIYIGGESENWAKEALSNKTNSKRTELSLLGSDAFVSYKEELTEGMEGEAEEDGIDEHIWLSVNVAEKCTQKIADVLSERIPSLAEKFQENADKYGASLLALDSDFRSKCDGKTIIFADRFPFRYFVEDYGLSYYAPFSGCSAESEASAKTVAFLADKVNELQAKYIFVLQGNNKKLAKTVAPDAEILVLNSMENTTTAENTSYIKLMSQNMDNILRAL